MKKSLFVYAAIILFIIVSGYKNVYSLETKPGVFAVVYKDLVLKDGVREINYEQFMKIRNSNGKYILLDARSAESYKAGHIELALSFPVQTIDKENAAKRLTKESNIIVYCAGFHCQASTLAAKSLSSFGYKVVDYKGGVGEWQEKGNKLVS